MDVGMRSGVGRWVVAVVMAVSSVSGCGGGDGAGGGSGAEEEAAVDVVDGGDAGVLLPDAEDLEPVAPVCRPDGLRSVWWSEVPGRVGERGEGGGFVGESLSGGLVMRSWGGGGWGTGAFRADNGEPLFVVEGPLGWQGGDRAWTVRVDVEGGVMGVTTMLTRGRLLEADVEGGQVLALVSPSGGEVAAVECGGGGAGRVRVWRLLEPGGGAALEVVGEEARVACAEDRRAAFGGGDLVVSGKGEVWRVGLEEGVWERRLVSLGVQGAWPGPLGRLAVVQSDGAVVGLERGAQLEEGVALGAVRQGQEAPPVVWSPEGAVVAWAAPEGVAVAAWSAKGGEVVSLEVPGSEEEPVVGLAFGEEGGTLVVGTTAGVGLWRCEGVAPQQQAPSPGVRVLLEGPAELAPGQEGVWTATHLGTRSLHGHGFFVDGVLQGAPSTERTLAWTPAQVGTAVIEVVVEDGIHVAREQARVEVR